MDSCLSVTSTIPNPQHDTTETKLTFPYNQVKLDPSIAESELEKVFKDLYLGIQVETTLGWTAADPSKLTDAIRANALFVKRFEDRGSIFMSAIATSELARAYEVLSKFYHSSCLITMLPNY
ncbi:uncharacterized protein LAJ45_03041 [Morchella importuna]|uniref:uncharacterized protein n=1 Tax=Morchella importuna TaxID=1174673 RepID=UPI001E8D2EC9|nr:uncharacterized protein LAJ45_03041 [Morchella importuna]KAH8152815.1 hypothetical protein LAJ45_03041 [Morchella importuna]